MERRNENKEVRTYDIHDIRWAKLQLRESYRKGFAVGFVFACVVLTGLVNLLLSLKGLLQ